MTKLEICAKEDSNQGVVYLYLEGSFYKAYGVSAWLLCSQVHPFKVSIRSLKGLEDPLLSVGFPISSLEKFSSGLKVMDGSEGVSKTLEFNGQIDLSGYAEWKASHTLDDTVNLKGSKSSFNGIPVYGLAYRLAIETTEMAARLERNYRYSLGEDVRHGVKKAVLRIDLAGKGEAVENNVHEARLAMMDVQLSLRMLNDLKILPDKRYVYFLEITENVAKQLSNWERSLYKRNNIA